MPDDPSNPPKPSPAKPSGPKPSGPPKPSIDAPSILEVVTEEPCPNCKAPLGTSAVVCLKCGYDMVAGRVRNTQMGEEVVVKEEPEDHNFITPGRGSPKLLLIVGTIVTVLALLAAGFFAPAEHTFWKRAALVLLVLYQTLFHTGTGALAVAMTGLALHQRVTRLDLVVTRMFVAFATFQMIRYCTFPIQAHEAVKFIVDQSRWIIALGAYWLIILLLFKKKPIEAGFILAIHLVLFLLTQFASLLEAAALVAPAAK